MSATLFLGKARKSTWLIGGAIASGVLLVLLFVLQAFEARLLELETRWLALACLPVVVGLLVSGVIKRFSGFGIEIESSLQAPTERVMIPAGVVTAELPGDTKRSTSYLASLPEGQRADVRRLAFALGRAGFYASHAVLEYFDRLPQLEFLEIRDEDGRFDSLLPVDLFREPGGRWSHQAIDDFIRALEERKVRQLYGSNLVTGTIRADEELVEVLPRVRRSQHGLLPVIDDAGRIVGVVTAAAIEREIADAVLRARG